MRTSMPQMVADHLLLQGITPSDHHNPVTTFTVLINSLSIAPGSYEHRVALPTDGYKTIRAILRGSEAVQIQGHGGCSAVGTDTSEESTAIGIRPYGAGGYPTSYMGAYSRLHGDSHLTWSGVFGTSITLQDLYLDGDEAVLVFYNTSGSNKNLQVYGTVVVK
jgi:hypothetical protein